MTPENRLPPAPKAGRLFIASAISPEQRDEVTGLILRLGSAGADVKWVSSENLHFTLRFLGAISEEGASGASRALERVSGETLAFTLSLEGLGAFPSFNKPSVIWLGVGIGSESLVRLAHRLEIELVEEGFKREERPFVPHLTLGRVRSSRGLDKLGSTLSAISFRSLLKSKVDRVILYRSRLTPGGPVYEPIRKFDFKG